MCKIFRVIVPGFKTSIDLFMTLLKLLQVIGDFEKRICRELILEVNGLKMCDGWVFRNFNVRHRQIKRLLHPLVKNDGMNVLGSHLGNLNRSRGKMTQFQ